MHTATPRGRSITLPLALVAALLLAGGCATVERSVEERHIESDFSENPKAVVVWNSNLYPDFEAKVSEDCYDRAEIGQPVPDGCVTPSTWFSRPTPTVLPPPSLSSVLS